MNSRKIIVVAGATGAQGGGLVRAILADPEHRFAVRALTRQPQSDAAQALARAGAEVVGADLDDAGSVDAAMRGAYAAFCVTFFWAHFSPEIEIKQARNLANGARRAGLEHVIWSTLEDTRRFMPLDDPRMPTLMSKYKVPHFDAKGEADQIFRDAGVPTTFLLTSFYWANLIHFGMGPRRAEDGQLVLALPMGEARLPGIAAEDIGRCAHGVFKRGLTMLGKTVGIVGEHLSGADMAAGLAQVLDEPVHYQAVPFDVYRGLGFPGAEDLGNMFQFKHDFNAEFCAARSVAKSRELNPSLRDFVTWAKAHKDRLIAA